MPTLRPLANTGINVAPIMFGGNVFGWTADRETSFTLLDRFVDRGFNFIDTADVYSRWKPGNQGGESETILGEWFRRSGKRGAVVLATKVGMDLGDGKKGLAAKYIAQACDASLMRLQTDHIDLYQAHVDDPAVPLEETLEAFGRLIDAGKVRAIGASNYAGDRLREAVELARRTGLPEYVTLQPEFNLHSRESFERDQQPVCEELGIGVIPYFALASGFLTGKYKTKADAAGANRESRVQRYFDARGERILKALEEVAADASAPIAAVSLAWLLAQPTILAPIASATKPEQLNEILQAADLTLTEPALRKLNEASAY